MLQREDVDPLLAAHSLAYELLIWIGEQAVNEPRWLAPDVVAQLETPSLAGRWLEAHRDEIPSRFLVDGPLDSRFLALLSSFFDSSFHVDHIDFGDLLVDAKLKVGALMPPGRAGPSSWAHGAGGVRGLEASMALAVKHLVASERMFLTQADARKLALRAPLREPALIWTYTWELDRRARGKGKGPIVRKIWRALPWSTRKNLSCEVVWSARDQLVEAAREATERGA